MGYTHYFNQMHGCPPADWEKICQAFRELQSAALLDQPLPIQREEDDSNPPQADSDVIAFNGIGELAHETLLLLRQPENNPFSFCKTARKPYDTTVVALLCLANHYSPGTWGISSDGAPEEWRDGLDLARTVAPNCELPAGVTGE